MVWAIKKIYLGIIAGNKCFVHCCRTASAMPKLKEFISGALCYLMLPLLLQLCSFHGATQPFVPNSFDPKLDFAASNYPRAIAAADFDIDGKPDLAVVHTNSQDLVIYRNTSNRASVVITPVLTIANGGGPMSLAALDLDGNGYPEIVVGNYDQNSVSVYRNTSTPGTISFAAKVDFATGRSPISVLLAEIDGNLQADIVTPNNNGNNISVLRNTSTPGNISFMAATNFPAGKRPNLSAAGDLDGDGRTDIAVTNYDDHTVSLLGNTGAVGTAAFAPPVTLATGTNPFVSTIADLDGDGKPEVLVGNGGSQSVSIFKNNSTSGIISFGARYDMSVPGQPLWIAVGNIDHDSKPEIVTANWAGSTVSVFRNTSTGGVISFDAGVPYTTGNFCRSVLIADMDGDGFSDLVTANSLANNVSVLRNAHAAFVTVDVCERSGQMLVGPNTNNALQWQVDKGFGFTNLADDFYHMYTNAPVLTVKNVPLTFQGYRYRVLMNGQVTSNAVYTLNILPSVIPEVTITASSTEICPGDDVHFTASVTNGGTNPAYQWLRNGQGIGAIWHTYTAANLKDGDSVTCIIRSSIGCAVPTVDTSKAVYIHHKAAPTAVISPASARVCAGNSQTFSVSGGASYQWFFNGAAITGATAAIYVASLPGVYSVQASNSICTVPATNNASLGVIPLPSGNITPATAILCPGASQQLTTTQAAGGYQWFLNNAIIPGATGSTHNATASGTYQLQLQNGDCMQMAANQTVITSMPAPSGAISPATASFCQGDSVQLTATGGTAYQWLLNGNNIVGATGSVFHASSSGVYSVNIFNTACSALATNNASVFVRALPKAAIWPEQGVVCAGRPVELKITGGNNYQWMRNGVAIPGETASVIVTTQPATYTAVVSDGFCPANTTNKAVVAQAPVQRGIYYSIARVASGVPFPLQARPLGQKFIWRPANGLNDSTIINPVVTTTGNQTYTVTISSATTCSVTDTVQVQVYNALGVYLPTAFSPNGDAHNEMFKPVVIGRIKKMRFTIYNRWGEIVFQTTEPGKGWNGMLKGQPLRADVFVWTCAYQLEGGKEEMLKGNVSLLR